MIVLRLKFDEVLSVFFFFSFRSKFQQNVPSTNVESRKLTDSIGDINHDECTMCDKSRVKRNKEADEKLTRPCCERERENKFNPRDCMDGRHQ